MRALERLVGDPEAFLGEVWEQRHAFYPAREAFADLVSLSEVDSLLALAGTDVRVFGGDPQDAPPKRYLDGATLNLMSVHLHHSGTARFCAELTDRLHHPVGANVYLTPPRSQAFPPHYDDRDVFIVQLQGRKRWRVFDSRVAVLPLAEPHPGVPEEQRGAVLEDRFLEAGEVLYLPRGVVHEAGTADTLSLHVTLGVHVFRAMDLFAGALRHVARRDERFRRALPPGFLDGRDLQPLLEELVAALPGALRAAEGTPFLASRLLSESASWPDGRFQQLADLEAVEVDTPLERRPGALCRVLVEGGRAVLDFPGGRVSGPPHLLEAFRFVAGSHELTPRDLPGLSDASRVVLARRLVREGLLRALP